MPGKLPFPKKKHDVVVDVFSGTCSVEWQAGHNVHLVQVADVMQPPEEGPNVPAVEHVLEAMGHAEDIGWTATAVWLAKSLRPSGDSRCHPLHCCTHVRGLDGGSDIRPLDGAVHGIGCHTIHTCDECCVGGQAGSHRDQEEVHHLYARGSLALADVSRALTLLNKTSVYNAAEQGNTNPGKLIHVLLEGSRATMQHPLRGLFLPTESPPEFGAQKVAGTDASQFARGQRVKVRLTPEAKKDMDEVEFGGNKGNKLDDRTVECAKWLIEARSHLELKWAGLSRLGKAMRCDHAEFAKLLVEVNADTANTGRHRWSSRAQRLPASERRCYTLRRSTRRRVRACPELLARLGSQPSQRSTTSRWQLSVERVL
mmetsp:Transcript_86542/g.166576  ORF Transcript_86542/g.166576 Transcript_86542/m.166576 type:complete len:370 (+) Transcript_86542:66-1175(+)